MEPIQEKSEEMTPEEQTREGAQPATAETETLPETEAVSETDKLNSELNEMKDKYVRLVADFENYKRRNARERMELIQTAGRDVITTLLDVLDDCDRA
jgi:molecular chaperone GrpE